MNTIPKDILKQLFENRLLRKETLGKDILWFMSFYFTDYLKYKTAPFQKEILKLIQDLDKEFIEILAFRGSAKSTYCSLVLPIFSIVGKHKKKHILLVGQNQAKSEQALMNIRQVWESSELLMRDFGPIRNETDPWNQNSLVFGHYGARISAVSVEKSVRGLIHGQYRPDLIIADDIEDVASSADMKQRDKLWQFITGELIPTRDLNTNFLFVGNLVHEDSTMVRLKKWLEKDKRRGVCKMYPLLSEKGRIAWPGKYSHMKAINSLKRNSPSELDFLREYMLKIVPAGDRIIFPEDIHRYTEKDLEPRADFQFYLILIDPAVSQKHTADNTAIIIARVYGSNGKLNICLLPHPVNKHMTWPNIIKELTETVEAFGEANYKILVEGGATQGGLIQMLQDEGLNTEEVLPKGNDKKVRLSMTRFLLQNGTILFPQSGMENLETQMFGFGTEKNDDLVDALTLIPLKKHDLIVNLSPNVEVVKMDMRIVNAVCRHTTKDWGDDEDEGILRSINRRGSWERLYG